MLQVINKAPLQDSNAPCVVFLSMDLMFYSKIQAAASQQQSQCIMVAALDKVADRTKIELVRWIVVDLFRGNLDLAAIVNQAREQFPEAKLIAFGPHVQREDLRLADEQGFDLVLTRGQFSSQMQTLFAKELPSEKLQN